MGEHPVRSGRILLVEDDEMVSGVLHNILSEKHTVTLERDGPDLEEIVDEAMALHDSRL
jgi:DNA-binding response OmpR family regulator